MHVREALKQTLADFETNMQQRIVEEKDHIIEQLKQNLVELTEKRFRTSLSNTSSKEASPAPLPSSSNMEFLLNEKENRIQMLLGELQDSQSEISRLKQTIKDQDDVILSHNNNRYVKKEIACLYPCFFIVISK